jgi:hypothetical protein
MHLGKVAKKYLVPLLIPIGLAHPSSEPRHPTCGAESRTIHSNGSSVAAQIYKGAFW